MILLGPPLRLVRIDLMVGIIVSQGSLTINVINSINTYIIFTICASV